MGKAVISDDEDEVELDEDDREPIDGDTVERDGADEDEDEEDEGPDEYEKDDFIVDDVDEEDEQEEEEKADSDEERQKKKKRKKKEEYVLDEDDYELLEDNNVIAPRRKGQFKRLKKAQRHAQGDVGGLSDEEEFLGTGKGGRTAEEKLKFSLFGDEEGPPLEDIAEEEEPAEAEDDGEDEMADFIVDEEFDEAGVPVRQKKLKKKKSRQAPGVSSSALQEAHDIFGDVDVFIRQRQQGLDLSEWKEKKLEDEFEPIVLSEKYMTVKDDQIREIDVPERIQVYEESSGFLPLDEKSIDDESTWIFNQFASGTVPFFGKTGLGNFISRDDIIGFLNLHHVQKLDVPFIALYRKEECPSILKDPEHIDMDDQNEKASALKWHKVLWSIQDLHRKWLLLQKRKSALQSYYEKRFDEESRRIYDETRLTLNQQLFESIMKSLKAAESEREVDDVDTKFNLHFPAGEIGVDEGQYKRPKRKSFYSTCSKAGLWEVASKFGYTSEQFGLQLSLEEMRMDELEDAKETPEELSSNFTCAMFETPQEVLKGARHMAAVEISCEPCVRKYVRSNYLDMVELSTSPTPDGNAAIDASHQFAGVKWLQRKPLNRFEDAQWLLIQKAEEEKLLQVTIKLPEDRLKKLMSDFNEYYLSDGVSKSAQLWNEQRKLILQDALFSFLLPSMEKEARALLTSRAKSWLLTEYGKVLWNKVSVGPYQRKENDISTDDEAAPRVMACCWGPGKPATTFVMLDSSGEVLDVLYTGSLTLRSQNVNDQQRKKNDQERVLKFMTEHQPHVAVLGAANLSCVRLKEDIYEIIFKMVEENPRDVGHDMDGLTIVYGDESLARLFENSRISSDQLPAQSGIVKRAVALGRYLQNPLAMVATLCGPGREILSWKLNPMENFLTQDEKYSMIEQVMVDVTNQFLSDKDPGESIIRPSSRGPSYLTLTLKVYDGVYAHKDVVEGGKEHKDITSLLRIGKTLKIGEDTFEDLDEVMDRYVDPLVSHLKTMLNYRKFRQGTKAEVDELLKIEKLEFPMRIVYCFGISHEHPGTFILTYIRSTNPHHEYVGLYPKGFKFRKKMFDSIDRLVAYFQKYIDEPQHESGQSIRSVAAMVPMRSPATAGSSGASAGSGWGGINNEGGWRGQSFDRDRSSTPSSRTGRNDYRNGGGRDGHPSGLPRPYGGRGYNDTWGSDAKDGNDGLGNFPGAKVQNSPGREAFPGVWGTDGSSSGGGGTGGWGGGANDAAPDNEHSGWGSDSKKKSSSDGTSGWGSQSGGGGGGW